MFEKLWIDPEKASPVAPSIDSDPASLYGRHHRRGRFFNPWGPFRPSPLDVVKAFALTRNPYDADRPAVASLRNGGPDWLSGNGPPTITWAGHATFAFREAGETILTDPHFGPRAAVVRRWTPPGFSLESIPGDCVAVVSHNHYDHLDDFTVRRLPKTIRWFVPPGLGNWLRRRGHRRVRELDWWQSAREGRWEITSLPAQHWSRRFGQPTNSTLWSSWLIDSGSTRLLFVGDSGYFHGFREFGRRLSPIDVAILPIGAYAPRWFLKYQHMNPEEAWQAFLDLGARRMIPSHWGAFRLTHEPIDQPPRDLRRAIARHGGDPKLAPLLAIGESWSVPRRPK